MTFKVLEKPKVLKGIIAFLLLVLAIVLSGFLFTQAKYKQVQDMRLVNGSISYKPSDMQIMAMYQADSTSETGYKEITKMPTSGYKISENKSYCEVNGTKDTEVRLYTNASGEHVFANLQKNSKCWLYFDNGKTMDTILASYNTGSRGSFSSVYTSATTKTIFTASDGLGTSKYFAGAPTDNYVKFGGFYWRIIRMNGDKTTRLIYAGKASVIDVLSNKQAVLANGYDDESTRYTQIKTAAFNATSSDNAYVGLKYAVGILRGTTNKSTILDELDTWYQDNLKLNYDQYITSNAGFCGDRTAYTDNMGSTSGGGTGTTVTFYGDLIRLYKNGSVSNASPSLSCSNATDLYTTSGSSRGNKVLTNPIGLINANEVAMAGGVTYINNTNYYLYTNNYYWTMSPFRFHMSSALLYAIDTPGCLGYGFANDNLGVRPVINLASNTRFVGTGTWNDPFVVSN